MIVKMVYTQWLQLKRTINQEVDRKTGPPFEDAKPVLLALENYKVQYCAVPAELSQLLPDYIAELPDPNWRTNTWKYTSSVNNTNFSLGVRLWEDNYVGHYYYG